MLNSGKKFALCATKKINILTRVVGKKIMNETKNHNPPLQVKWSVPKKSMEVYFKLQNCLSSTNPSIDTFLPLYDHTIKPILTYRSEIWGMFSVDSSSCRKKSNHCFEFFLNQPYRT